MRCSWQRLKQNGFRLNHPFALAFCLSMIFSEKPASTFRDHALMEISAAQRQRFGLGTRAPGKFQREKVAVAQPRQLRGKIDKAFCDHMDDKSRALQPAAH